MSATCDLLEIAGRLAGGLSIACIAALLLASLALASAAEEQTSSSGAAAKPDATPGIDLQAELDAACARAGLPAMAAAIVTPDSIKVAVTGVRRQGVAGAVTLDDRWHLGSNTKAMTATMIGLLIQQGRLGWDTRPLDVWPELEERIKPEYRDITVEQLLQHRAGIQPYTDGAEMVNLPEFPEDPTAMRRAFAVYVLCGTEQGKVGEFQYSNAGYGIAAAIAESATGESYDSLMEQYIFESLGIAGVWGWPALQPQQPWGHAPDEQGRLQPEDPFGDYKLPQYIAPAGDLSMNIGDYCVFAQAHLRGMMGLEPRDKAGVPAVPGITSDLIQRLHENTDTYSCGWGELFDNNNSPTSMHEGSAGTFDVLTIIQPGRGRAAVVFCNAGGDAASAAVKELCQSLLR